MALLCVKSRRLTRVRETGYHSCVLPSLGSSETCGPTRRCTWPPTAPPSIDQHQRGTPDEVRAKVDEYRRRGCTRHLPPSISAGRCPIDDRHVRAVDSNRRDLLRILQQRDGAADGHEFHLYHRIGGRTNR